MPRVTIKDSDKKQVAYLSDRLNAFWENKFQLLADIEQHKKRNKIFTHLTLTCQQLTDEIKRMDETRNGILMNKEVKELIIEMYE